MSLIDSDVKDDIYEVLARDKINLDITWIKDNNAVNIDNLPEPSKFLYL